MIARWLCEKCKRKWAYPLENCAFCLIPLKKQRGTKTKIIGMTTVSIPSINHSLVPYHVVLLVDEFGNRMPKKTMKKVKIGDLFSFSIAKTEHAVALMRVKYDVEGDVLQALSLLRKIDVKPSDKILIKVSCIEQSTQIGAFTNPKVLDSVIKWLRGKGIEDMVVGEQALLGDSVDAASKTGILSTCKKNNVSFVDISKETFVEKEVDVMKIKIAKSATERKIINIPVMKTHAQYGIAGAFENLMRLLDLDSQKTVYEKGISKMLPKLAVLLPSVLTVGDASVVMQNAPSGEPAFMRVILASTSSLNLDKIFSEMGMVPIPTYLQEVNSKEIEIVGEDLDCVKIPLKLAKDGSPNPYVRFVGEVNLKLFMEVVSICRKLNGVGSNGATIQLAMGKFTKEMIDMKERIVFYGKDAIEVGKSLSIGSVAQLTEEMPELQKIVLLRGLLEDAQKKRIGVADMFKVKLAEFSNK